MRLIKSIARAFGFEEIPDELSQACAARVKLACSRVDLTIYRRKQAQARLEVAAQEAIVGAFKDYFPDKSFAINGYWPHAHATLKGHTAWIEIDIGIDYADPDEGLEVIELHVDRHPKQISIREKIEDHLFNRTPRKTRDKTEIPLSNVVRPLAPKEMAPIGKPEKQAPMVAEAKPASRRRTLPNKGA